MAPAAESGREILLASQGGFRHFMGLHENPLHRQ
jgi:hypothetical protein